MDRFDALQVLIAAVDAGSLSAGARALNVPLPSVSRKVAELERHLDTKLLVRTSRNVLLTDAGRDFVASGRRILDQLHEAERRATGEYQAPRGELTITMPVEFGRRYVMPVAMDFLSRQPDISLNIISMDRSLQMLEEHVDVGVRLGALVDSSLVAVKVGELHMVTCASPAYVEQQTAMVGQAPKNGQSVRFPALDGPWWETAAAGAGDYTAPAIRLRANTAGVAVQAALRGVGILKVLNYLVADELRSGALVRIPEDHAHAPVPVHLIYPNQGLLPLKVRSFLDWAVPRMRQELQQLRDL